LHPQLQSTNHMISSGLPGSKGVAKHIELYHARVLLRLRSLTYRSGKACLTFICTPIAASCDHKHHVTLERVACGQLHATILGAWPIQQKPNLAQPYSDIYNSLLPHFPYSLPLAASKHLHTLPPTAYCKELVLNHERLPAHCLLLLPLIAQHCSGHKGFCRNDFPWALPQIYSLPQGMSLCLVRLAASPN
jgi:hypothetical protein